MENAEAHKNIFTPPRHGSSAIHLSDPTLSGVEL